MGVLSLKVCLADRAIQKTMQFEPATLVYDACKIIREKMQANDANPKDYGLFRVEDDPTKCVWMENGRTLEYYLVRNGDTVEYKKKIRALKVRMLDDTVKMLMVDESQPVGQLMITICSKIGISNYEEYSMVRQRSPDWKSTLSLKDDSKNNSLGFGTLGRNKERKMEQLRQKLHTDEELAWLDHSKTLREQAIPDDETLLLRRKYFFSDTNVDCRDPVQLNLLYVQCRDGVIQGLHPVTRDMACDLAALQCQIQYGDLQDSRQKSAFLDLRELLPKEYVKTRDNEKRILQSYRELAGTSELDAKSKYVHLCRSLITYGVTFFVVKEKMKGKNKLVPRLLGINKECVMRVDEKTKEVLKEWPLEQVRRWAASPKTFTLDFGDYQEAYYSVQTADGEKIAQLIAGYIDIILKKKRTRDHLGIEGDEGSTMLEDMVAPARATLVAHGQIGPGFAQEGQVALPGVLRSGGAGMQRTGSGNAAHYGAVSGQLLQQNLGKGQRARVVESTERAQRALIGTIEASIRAVEAAEEEMERHIELPKFADDPASRKWRDTEVEVKKVDVGGRIASMGAATAEVVQLTSVPDEIDERVGQAISVIGSNLPEMGRGVRQLASMMHDERQAGDLVEAARKLCGAFSDFLTTVNPEHEEKRTTVLAAAGRVGDFSQAVMNTMETQTEETRQFNEHLVQRAKHVATSTAQLVLKAKTVSAECEEPVLQDKVIHSATQCAFATSQLVACARVVAPTIETPACQEQLVTAAKQVSRTVQELLIVSESATQHSTGDGRRTLGDIHEAARQVTSALDGLLDHVKTSPKQVQTHEHDERFDRIITSSDRLITYQGPSTDMVQQARSLARHSTVLAESIEAEAVQRPDQRDRLYEAARTVSHATQSMMEAAERAQRAPQAAEPQVALRTAAEHLRTVTTEVTSEQQAARTMHRLEQAAKEAAAAATQTIAAANASQQHIQNRTVTETLIVECTETAEHVPRLISSIRESQAAQVPSEKYRAQSRLIRDSAEVLRPAARLVEVARQTVPAVVEQNVAGHLQSTSQQLSTQLAELRVAISNAQQVNFDQQLNHSEDLIRELDRELIEIRRAAQAGQLTALPGESPERAVAQLSSATRHVGSSLAQLVSAAAGTDRQHVGASAVEAAQALRQFTHTVHTVCATRKETVIERLIVSARSVVHDSGAVFDRVRERADAGQLAQAAKAVSTSLRQCLAALPDQEHVQRAIATIRDVGVTTQINGHAQKVDLRQAAGKLIESTNQLVVQLHAPQQTAAVDVFVRTYTDFHTAVTQAIAAQPEPTERRRSMETLETARREAVSVLERMRASSSDTSNSALTQSLTQSTRTLTETVNVIVESVVREAPWQSECDSAVRQIESVRHQLEQGHFAINEEGHYENLDTVTEQSRRLGEGMMGISRIAKSPDIRAFCESVRQTAHAVCGLAEGAVQSAYLVGVAEPSSQPGRAALVDSSKVTRSVEIVKTICERIQSGEYNQQQILDDATTVAKHTSTLANVCRDASNRSTNINTKKQFINCAREVASSTATLITAVKAIDRQFTEHNQRECAQSAAQLCQATEQLEAFVDSPEYGAVAAKISPAGRQAQQPILTAGRQMLDGSIAMIHTAKQLAAGPKDEATWRRFSENSTVMSESIKRLLAAIREHAPGQADMETAIRRVQQLIAEVDRASMESMQNQRQESTTHVTEQSIQQQIIHTSQALVDRTEPLRRAAVQESENIAHAVREQMAALEPLVHSCISAATMSHDSQQQSVLFDQCKTVTEAELQFLTACKDSAGNPKAREMHRVVDEQRIQLLEAVTELQRNLQMQASDAGVMHGMVDTISRSIARTDETLTAVGSFADAQTRMMSGLEEIARIARDMPITDPRSLGPLAVRLSECYAQVAEDSRQAFATVPSPDVAQRLRVAVQQLGTANIELVKVAGQRRAHPQDQRTLEELSHCSHAVVERVQAVLAALHLASKGTQACINAASTVSGIIGDLNTTILFATAGTLNPDRAQEQQFGDHREAILKTAKALVEDTKALVAGAASNQEQLAVAAQNAVRTIVNLSDAVKNGAVSLTSENSEAQVLVMHAVRDVAAALSSLIQATKNAFGRSLQDPAMNSLKEAAKVMVTNVTSLLKTVKTVEDEHQRGTRALEAAVEAIAQEVKSYDSGDGASRSTATAEEMVRTAKHVTEATARAAAAGHSLLQDDAIAAANLARQAVSDLLVMTRAAAQAADSPDLRYKTIDSGRDVALAVRSLLITLQQLLARSDPAARQQLLEASRQVARAVGDLTACAELLKGDAWTDTSDPTVIAENELVGAANSIEAAAHKLAQLRPRHVHKVDESLTFDEQILSAAKSIANAVQTLVKAASAAQRELVEQGRLDPTQSSLASEDYQWSEGLISAARMVAAAVHSLCEAANGLVQGHSTEEKLISAAKQVAASTAHLLVACKVKSDIDSRAMQRLQSAGHAVKTATEHLVMAARQAISEDERQLVISQRMVSGIAQVMDAQEEVLRKERELNDARKNLAAVNKARYDRQGRTPTPD